MSVAKRWVVLDGVTYTLPKLAKKLGVSETYVRGLKDAGDSDERIVERSRNAVHCREASRAVEAAKVTRYDPWRDLPYARDTVAQACVARVVARGYGMTLEEVGWHMGMSKSRVQQLEELALAKLKAAIKAEE